ncbi:MAG: Gfo/Idh/MocA family oxidoreductase [Oscillospiraceae bacterium]|nr:Gfo/Idh/MocA family oxidoreductase [Oscillospiraceae bacterium]
MIKVGLIGCGFMGGMHAACYKALEGEGVKVTAVADVRPDFAKKLADLSGAEIYATGMELIEKADVDVIDVCLPTHLHAAHGVAAMKAGKNLFLEKPVCLKEEEMEELLKTEKETGVKVQIGQVIRQFSAYIWLKGVVDSKEFGELRSASFRRLSNLPTWAWENWLHTPDQSGTVTVDMHVHDADFVRYILGEPKAMQSMANRDADGVIQQIYTQYDYGNGVAVTAEACWDYPADFPFTADYIVKFEKATVQLKDGVVTVYPKEGGSYPAELPKEYEGENDIGGNISSLGGYYTELKYFVEGLQGKNDLSIATLADAIESVRLVKKEVELAGGAVKK